MNFRTIAAVLLLTVMGCSGSQVIISSWRTENILPKQYKKILVLAIIKETDRKIRMEMEEHFAGDLNDIGYDASTSFNALGRNTFTESEDSAIHYIRQSGADAVLTIVLLDKQNEQEYVTGRIEKGPVQDVFDTYYSNMYNRVYHESYFRAEKKYYWETNLYDVATKQLMYSVVTQSFVPSTSEVIGPHGYGKMIVSDMVHNRVL